MECLCQFLKIVGKTLDSVKGHNLMDQYFGRLKRIRARATGAPSVTNNGSRGEPCHKAKVTNTNTGSDKLMDGAGLPARIRFMLDDIIDLRENGWLPRHVGQRGETNKPRYLRDIRMEVFKVSQCT